MRKYFDHLRNLLTGFIDQRDDMLMLLACRPSESALMMKMMLDHQNHSKDDLFFLFTQPFTNSQTYVAEICGRLHREYQASIEDGIAEDALPPPPIDCLPESKANATVRLQACLAYGRSLVPATTGHRIVWCFGPESIQDVDSYLGLWHACLPNPAIEIWMRGARLIVRVPETISSEIQLAQAARVQYHQYIIPDDAAEEQLREDSKNPKLPISDRQQAQLQLAFIDLAHGRCSQAKPALLETLAYHQQKNDPALQALAMIGLGDTCRRENDIDKAKYWYECAIRPAGEGKQIMSLAMVSQHLGSIAFERHKFEDAEFYFDQLSILKRAIPDETGLVDALLWRSRAQVELGQLEPALAGYQEALLVCKAFDLSHREEECLAEFKRVFILTGQPVQAEITCQEWRSVEALSQG